MSIARPAAHLLRHPYKNEIKYHFAVSIALGVVCSTAYYFMVNKPRKAAYAKFHQTYDEQRHFKRMAEAGVFSSVKPNMPAPKWVADYEKEVDKAIAALKK